MKNAGKFENWVHWIRRLQIHVLQCGNVCIFRYKPETLECKDGCLSFGLFLVAANNSRLELRSIDQNFEQELLMVGGTLIKNQRVVRKRPFPLAAVFCQCRHRVLSCQTNWKTSFGKGFKCGIRLWTLAWQNLKMTSALGVETPVDKDSISEEFTRSDDRKQNYPWLSSYCSSKLTGLKELKAESQKKPKLDNNPWKKKTNKVTTLPFAFQKVWKTTEGKSSLCSQRSFSVEYQQAKVFLNSIKPSERVIKSKHRCTGN